MGNRTIRVHRLISLFPFLFHLPVAMLRIPCRIIWVCLLKLLAITILLCLFAPIILFGMNGSAMKICRTLFLF